MSIQAVALVAHLARALPMARLEELADAVGESRPGLLRLRSHSSSDPMRAACTQLAELMAEGCPPAFLEGALRTAIAVADRGRSAEPVWTGPDVAPGSRLTLAVVCDLIASAVSDVLLVSYATYPSRAVNGALADAAARGVAITLLLERPEDNPGYDGPSDPFPELKARRLCWPRAARPPGAALHTKLLVVDRRLTLIGSANLTGRALETNIEAGLLVSDPAVATSLHDHVAALVAGGALVDTGP